VGVGGRASGPPKLAERRVRIPHVCQNQAKVIVGPSVARIQCNRLAKVHLRLAPAILQIHAVAQVTENCGASGRKLQGAAKQLTGNFVIAQAIVQDGQSMGRHRMVGLQLEHVLVGGHRPRRVGLPLHRAGHRQLDVGALGRVEPFVLLGGRPLF